MYRLVFLGATELVGHLSRAQALLALPIGLVGTALAQVFQQRAAQEMAQTGTFWATYKSLFLVLAIGALVVVSGIALGAPQFFTVFLGPQWERTGAIAQIIAPMICLRMIAGPALAGVRALQSGAAGFLDHLWPVRDLSDSFRSGPAIGGSSDLDRGGL
jgi:O-antigen/teichoic acid export membrane protein